MEKNMAITHKEISKLLDQRREELWAIAQDVCDRFWNLRKAGNEIRKKGERSIMGCRVRKKTGGSLEICWYVNNSSRYTEDNPRIFSEHISRGNTYKYSNASLKKKSKDWEVDMILKTEEIYAKIREEMADISEINRKIKVMIRRDQKIEIMDEQAEDICAVIDLW
jgi:hypothetical protein